MSQKEYRKADLDYISSFDQVATVPEWKQYIGFHISMSEEDRTAYEVEQLPAVYFRLRQRQRRFFLEGLELSTRELLNELYTGLVQPKTSPAYYLLDRHLQVIELFCNEGIRFSEELETVVLSAFRLLRNAPSGEFRQGSVGLVFNHYFDKLLDTEVNDEIWSGPYCDTAFWAALKHDGVEAFEQYCRPYLRRMMSQWKDNNLLLSVRGLPLRNARWFVDQTRAIIKWDKHLQGVVSEALKWEAGTRKDAHLILAIAFAMRGIRSVSNSISPEEIARFGGNYSWSEDVVTDIVQTDGSTWRPTLWLSRRKDSRWPYKWAHSNLEIDSERHLREARQTFMLRRLKKPKAINSDYLVWLDPAGRAWAVDRRKTPSQDRDKIPLE
ncbi:MAG: hypothetical protein Q7K33_01740 [Candidatus Berkelbacteria bacterium]|nr:hypothetical protein [Candidatus Berkelbacteria bacterium]